MQIFLLATKVFPALCFVELGILAVLFFAAGYCAAWALTAIVTRS